MADEPQSPPEECEEGAPEWVVTFGDMMSLLLCFFILLLSFSETDAAKYKEVAGSLEKAFGVQRVKEVMNRPSGMRLIARDFNQAFIEQTNIGSRNQLGDDEKEFKKVSEIIKEEFNKSNEIKELEKKGIIKLDEDENYLIIRLIGQATFDSGKATIEKSILPALITIGDILKKSNHEVIVAGHTDNVPLKSNKLYESNLVLSSARAATIVQFFIDNKFMNPQNISTMGYGEYRPLVNNDNEANRQLNRRVDIKISRNKKVN